MTLEEDIIYTLTNKVKLRYHEVFGTSDNYNPALYIECKNYCIGEDTIYVFSLAMYSKKLGSKVYLLLDVPSLVLIESVTYILNNVEAIDAIMNLV